ETYTAGQAFAGEYVISVERFRGRPLGNRAQLRVIQHQGTPEESEQLVTVDLTTAAPVKVRLANGRRTEAAYVPPPAAQRPPEPATAHTPKPDVLAQLRDASDPEVTGMAQPQGFRAGADSPTARRVMTATADKAPAPSPNDQSFYQTKIDSFVKNSLDVTAQAVLSADR